ncbi:hypothetical protein EG359_21430 [Chryseobacterium joostei]|uniref:Tetratricopeptide repeat protein n=1 Tax=Chryseobacterium joostei TaxID=112234 RepID=A0A1N7IDC2_9FLAO|nr:hypothetical protein [Chryseobacterium joostei]AZB01991.1 hypothetical protein EG359_21430 [Chryseobacterium joostei]SIS35012.1 hypothetical protein SAMN05421768_104193 [Chryseobacterium joostei]
MKKMLFILGLTCSVFCYSQKKEMVAAFKTKNYIEALSLGHKVLENIPNDFDANLLMAASYNNLGDFQKSLLYSTNLETLSENDEKKSWALMQLMAANYGLGNKEASKKYYDLVKSIKLSEKAKTELNTLIKRLGLDDFYNQWNIVETENLIFHFENSISEEARNRIAKSRQKAFTKINEFFGAKLPKKIDFFVWGSNDTYNEFLEHNLGFTQANYCVSHNRLNQTAGHEIAHNLSFWRGSRGKITTQFINEGIGVCFDLNENDKLEAAKQAYKKSPIDIKKVWSENQKISSDILYPVSGAFVEFLIKYDKVKFIELNNDQTYENAKKVYGNEIEILIENFMNKLK